ncbi:MAG: hypothetical protein CL927_20215 [Deltaproteobacteria bacterium]|nr:hypothetical protein [Deltaproteobacteria bacterium]HCH61407.1 hypothetical protein [Deltaproteobacteria bacterium]
MTPPDMAVRPVGTLPAAVLDALLHAGVRLDPAASLGVVWYEHPAARTCFQRPDLPSVVAFVADDEQEVNALADGAVDALRTSTPALASRLFTIARVDRQWQIRLEAQLSEEHRIESELQSTRDLLSRLIDTTPCPVMAVGPGGDLLVFNRAAEAVLGYEIDWAQQHLKVNDVYVESGDARRILSAIRASPRRMVRGLRTRLRTRRGDTLEVSLNAAEVYGADGLPVATIGVFPDTRSRDDLSRRLDSTATQMLRLEAENAAVSASLAEVHYLNQPLNTSMLTIEMLMLQEGLPSATLARLERIYKQLEKLAEKVSDLTTKHHRTLGGHRLLGAISAPMDSEPPSQEDPS